jgi:hypothetical protein
MAYSGISILRIKTTHLEATSLVISREIKAAYAYLGSANGAQTVSRSRRLE